VRWLENWNSASVVDSHLVADPTIRQPGFDLPRWQWSLLNCFCTVQGHCSVCQKRWRQVDSDLCACGEPQMMSQIVDSCPSTKLVGGLSKMHSADDELLCGWPTMAAHRGSTWQQQWDGCQREGPLATQNSHAPSSLRTRDYWDMASRLTCLCACVWCMLVCVHSRGSDAVGQRYGERTFREWEVDGGECATVEPWVADLRPASRTVAAAGRSRGGTDQVWARRGSKDQVINAVSFGIQSEYICAELCSTV